MSLSGSRIGLPVCDIVFKELNVTHFLILFENRGELS
jgi:hypothetical protein